MGTLDYIIIALVAVWIAVAAILVWRRHTKGGGCCGGSDCRGCDRCARKCEKKNK